MHLPHFYLMLYQLLLHAPKNSIVRSMYIRIRLLKQSLNQYVLYYIICHYVNPLPLDMGLFSSLCCLVPMWLPLFVLNVCLIPFPGLLITASWYCIGTGFHMHGIYFSVIHFDNFNLTVLQASFLSCSIALLPPGYSCWYYPCLGTWWHCILIQTSLTFTIGFYKLFASKLLTHPLALCLQPLSLSGIYCGWWWVFFFFAYFSFACFLSVFLSPKHCVILEQISKSLLEF